MSSPESQPPFDPNALPAGDPVDGQYDPGDQGDPGAPVDPGDQGDPRGPGDPADRGHRRDGQAPHRRGPQWQELAFADFEPWDEAPQTDAEQLSANELASLTDGLHYNNSQLNANWLRTRLGMKARTFRVGEAPEPDSDSRRLWATAQELLRAKVVTTRPQTPGAVPPRYTDEDILNASHDSELARNFLGMGFAFRETIETTARSKYDESWRAYKQHLRTRRPSEDYLQDMQQAAAAKEAEQRAKDARILSAKAYGNGIVEEQPRRRATVADVVKKFYDAGERVSGHRPGALRLGQARVPELSIERAKHKLGLHNEYHESPEYLRHFDVGTRFITPKRYGKAHAAELAEALTGNANGSQGAHDVLQSELNRFSDAGMQRLVADGKITGKEADRRRDLGDTPEQRWANYMLGNTSRPNMSKRVNTWAERALIAAIGELQRAEREAAEQTRNRNQRIGGAALGRALPPREPRERRPEDGGIII